MEVAVLVGVVHVEVVESLEVEVLVEVMEVVTEVVVHVEVGEEMEAVGMVEAVWMKAVEQSTQRNQSNW